MGSNPNIRYPNLVAPGITTKVGGGEMYGLLLSVLLVVTIETNKSS